MTQCIWTNFNGCQCRARAENGRELCVSHGELVHLDSTSTCPVCCQNLSSVTEIVMLVGCRHLICLACAQNSVTEAPQHAACPVCEVPYTHHLKSVISDTFRHYNNNTKASELIAQLTQAAQNHNDPLSLLQTHDTKVHQLFATIKRLDKTYTKYRDRTRNKRCMLR